MVGFWHRSEGSSLYALWSVTRSVPRRTSNSPAASRPTSFQKQYPEYSHHQGEIVALEPITKSAETIHRSLHVRNESEFVQCQGMMIPASCQNLHHTRASELRHLEPHLCP